MKIALMLTAYDKMSQVVNSAVSKTEARLKGLKKFSKGLDEFADKSLIAGGLGTAFFAKTIADVEEERSAIARLNQVFRQMGYANSMAAQMSTVYASKLEKQYGVEAEVIMATEAKLATFSNLINKTGDLSNAFERATRLSFDMAAAGFGEADQNAVQLGKALQDPILGINALRRSGISFTEAEKEKIKVLVQSGKLYKAQNIILAAIEKQVGGVAATTVKTSAKSKIALGEVSKTIGHILLPIYDEYATKVIAFIPKVQAFIEKHKALVVFVAKASIALLAAGTAAKVLSFAISGLSGIIGFASKSFKFLASTVSTVTKFLIANPIVAIIAAVALAAFLIYKYWGPIKNWFSNLWGGIKNIFAKSLDGIKFYLTYFTPIGLIVKYWTPLSNFFKKIWNAVTGFFRLNVRLIKNILNPFKAAKLIYAGWQSLKGWFGQLWQGVVDSFSSFWSWLKSIPQKFYEAGKNMMKSLWAGIKAVAMAPVNAVKSIVKKIRNFLPFSPAKEGPLRDIHRIKLIETIAATIKPDPLVKAMQRATGSFINDGANTMMPAFGRNNQAIVHLNYAPVINGGDNGTVRDNLRTNSRELMKIIQEEMRKINRTKF